MNSTPATDTNRFIDLTSQSAQARQHTGGGTSPAPTETRDSDRGRRPADRIPDSARCSGHGLSAAAPADRPADRRSPDPGCGLDRPDYPAAGSPAAPAPDCDWCQSWTLLIRHRGLKKWSVVGRTASIPMSYRGVAGQKWDMPVTAACS